MPICGGDDTLRVFTAQAFPHLSAGTGSHPPDQAANAIASGSPRGRLAQRSAVSS